MSDDNHTSIAHLMGDGQVQDATPLQPQVPPPAQDSPQPSPAIDPVSVAATKEAGPTVLRQESATEQKSEVESPPEQEAEQEKKNKGPHKNGIPDIHPDAAKAGLQVAPSASPFPTIYDVKVPVLKDEEIEKDLHLNFYSGARWLAEVCRYILWQAHVKLKKIGGKVVRERIQERF